ARMKRMGSSGKAMQIARETTEGEKGESGMTDNAKGTYVIRCDSISDAFPKHVPENGFRMTIRDDPERKCNIKGRSCLGADFDLGVYEGCIAQFYRADEIKDDYSIAREYREIKSDEENMDSEYDSEEEKR